MCPRPWTFVKYMSARLCKLAVRDCKHTVGNCAGISRLLPFICVYHAYIINVQSTLICVTHSWIAKMAFYVHRGKIQNKKHYPNTARITHMTNVIEILGTNKQDICNFAWMRNVGDSLIMYHMYRIGGYDPLKTTKEAQFFMFCLKHWLLNSKFYEVQITLMACNRNLLYIVSMMKIKT